ncbi:MAG: hypothetical protein DRH07_02310 [Deltaproteobacteria bacterium]|nr:MAG: hypothetical protein DRH07_02310 [Deltaproteobacteria bacterium]
MNQTDEFAASLLIVRQPARLKIDFLEGLLKQETGCVDCSNTTGFLLINQQLFWFNWQPGFHPATISTTQWSNMSKAIFH